MTFLNLLTLNIQGLNSPPKCTKAFRYFSKLSAHVVCLQETHFTTQSSPKYFGWKYPQVFTASANTKQRGVLIAFHHTTPFSLRKELKDPEGRYLKLSGLLLDDEVTITVVSYYAPHKNPLSFLSHLLSVVETHKSGTLILGGDSNLILYPPEPRHLDSLFKNSLTNNLSWAHGENITQPEDNLCIIPIPTVFQNRPPFGEH